MKRNPTLSLALISLVIVHAVSQAQRANEITWAVKYDPRTFDPAKVDDQVSETVRYLTAGVLLRLDRRTLTLEPQLASAWSQSADGRVLTFTLRKGLRFSDGTPLTSADVVWSLQRVLSPATAAPVAEEFGQPGTVTVDAPDPSTVRVHLPKRLVAVGNAFDEIAIEPANRPSSGRVTAGPFVVADYKAGTALRLKRNPYYWKRDSAGKPLPYLDAVQLDILANPEQNEARFLRGQYQLLESVPADNFMLLAQKASGSVRDLGASLNTEQMWFNQSPAAPLPAWEKGWFASADFRGAVSMAIHRSDLARIAYAGHATPAGSSVSPANTQWHNAHVPAMHEDVAAATQLLAHGGFRKQGEKLVDRDGHPVRFTILTNAGNRSREKMASLIQQDLAAVGVEVNVVTLDFPALIERLMKTQNYEAAILGLTNVQPDPTTMDNVWLSSSANHQWNPGEKTPATPWEAELDRLVQAQDSAASFSDRKRAVDRMQEIVADQQPFLYLVYPNALYAVTPALEGVVLTAVQPGVISNIDSIRWKSTR